LTACDARRFCPRQVRRQHRKLRRLNHPPLGLARCIGAVGLFRSPNLFSATPMIPVTGLDAGAGKAGLIQSSAPCPAGLECRKVLFRQKVTTIRGVSCTLFPESQIGLESAGGPLDSTVTARSSWRRWRFQGTEEFTSRCAGFAYHPRPTTVYCALRSDHALRSEWPAQPAQMAPCGQRCEPLRRASAREMLPVALA
jgi:hypothetical protein